LIQGCCECFTGNMGNGSKALISVELKSVAAIDIFLRII